MQCLPQELWPARVLYNQEQQSWRINFIMKFKINHYHFKWALSQLCRSQECPAWNRKPVQLCVPPNGCLGSAAPGTCSLPLQGGRRGGAHLVRSRDRGEENEAVSFKILSLIKNVAFCSDEFVPRIWLLNQVWGS